MQFVSVYKPTEQYHEVLSEPSKIIEFTPDSNGVYPIKSNVKQMFKVKYSYKSLVVKKIYFEAYRDRRWIETTYEDINFKIKTEYLCQVK